MARQINTRDLKPVIDAVQKWIHDCLIGDGSIFSSESLWTAALIEEVKRAFVDHPDMGEDSFGDKLKKQMQKASASAQRLMGEMLWAVLAFPSNVGETKKREQIRNIWNMSGEVLPENHPMLSDAVLSGIGSGGQAYNNLRWMELTFLIELAGDLKKENQTEREKIFSSYDDFVEWIKKFSKGEKRQFRHMLRYFAFPDRVERMSSNNHRQAILAKFGIAPEKETRKWNDRELDDALLKLREKLKTENPDKTLDFYEEPLRHVWYNGQEDSGGEPPKTLATPVDMQTNPAVETSQNGVAYWWLNANPKMWDFRNAPVGSVHAYTSLNHNAKKRRIYAHFQAVKPGDLMLGYVTNPDKEVVGLCEITKPLHKAAEGEVFEFKKIEQFRLPVTWTELQSQPGLGECEPLNNNQGSLFALTKAEYETIRELIDAQDSEEVVTTPQPFSVANALDGLFMGKDQFEAMLSSLRRKKALVLQGPPGVGKTFVAHRIAYALMRMKDEKRVTMVQFHPSYSYEDFIQGYRPARNGTLQRRNGVFYEFARQARNNPSQDWVFIIDEINRGNLAKIFGELLMLLEADKRGQKTQVSLTYSETDETFYLPENLFVIGTMNTADRSLAMVDYALRRRFAFQTLAPAVDSLEFSTWFLKKGASKQILEKIVARVGKLNSIIDAERDLGERFRIGHSFFCPGEGDKPDDAWYHEIITREIAPLLEEYFDVPKRVKQMVDDLLA